ncbi:hypothetical protein LINGRAHAP2_LOCUS15157 [Linum grandiflorum]
MIRLRNKNSNDKNRDSEKFVSEGVKRFSNLKNNAKNKVTASSPTCYRCGRIGHRKVDCPLKEQALQAVWRDSDEDSDDSDEKEEVVAHMAIADEATVNAPNTEEVCYRVGEGSQK